MEETSLFAVIKDNHARVLFSTLCCRMATVFLPGIHK